LRKHVHVRELPPPLELCCLKALWRIGEGTVHDVREAVRSEHDLAYTTVLTLLDRLSRRGFASRRKLSRAFVYAPALDQERGREIAVQELLAVWFNGDRAALRSYLGAEPVPPAATPAPAPEPQREPEPVIETALL
jgi:predicted transcriptional regulator